MSLHRHGKLQGERCVVQALKELGVLTIVDMHQDFYSRYLNKGCGEGFPRCATPSLKGSETCSARGGCTQRGGLPASARCHAAGSTPKRLPCMQWDA